MNIEVLDDKYLCLHKELATGEYKGKPFRLIQELGTGSIIFVYDKKNLRVKLQSIVEECIDLLEKKEEIHETETDPCPR